MRVLCFILFFRKILSIKGIFGGGTMNKWNVSIIKLALIVILTSSLLLGCDNNEKSISTEQWIEDIDYLAGELSKRHVVFNYITDEDEFYRKIEALKKDVPKLNDDEIEVELSRILASIGVAHTGLVPNIEYYFPIKLYWFEEGIYLINTTEEYKEALNTKLIRINGMEIDEIVDAVSTVISTENDAWLKYQVPSYIRYSDILYGLGITDTKESATFTFENLDGKAFDIKINSISDFNRIEFIVEADGEPNHFLNNKEEYYWYEYLPEHKTVYFQYNQCFEIEEKSFSDFNEELFDFIDNNSVDKLIIDLRNNTGGNSSVFEPFLEEINKYPNLNNKENLFVLVGRETFSSGVFNAAQLFSSTNATFIGETMGGELNLYGDTLSLKMENSGIYFYYSTKKFQWVYNRTTLIPIKTVDYTIDDYINGIDPAMERVINSY